MPVDLPQATIVRQMCQHNSVLAQLQSGPSLDLFLDK